MLDHGMILKLHTPLVSEESMKQLILMITLMPIKKKRKPTNELDQINAME